MEMIAKRMSSPNWGMMDCSRPGDCGAMVHEIPVMRLVAVVKADKDEQRAWLAHHDDTTFEVGMNLPVLHSADKCLPQVKA